MADKSKGINDRQNLIEFAAFVKSQGMEQEVLDSLDNDDTWAEKMIAAFLDADEKQQRAMQLQGG